MKYSGKLPFVTIVTPSYNQGCFIEETILSVLNQDYPHIEYLVIDGGSTDDTLEILRKYEDRLIWISEPDRGQSHAINKGFQMAKAEIICWLNSDDIFELGAIRKAVEYFIDNPDVMMIYGDGNYVDEYGKQIQPHYSPEKFVLFDLIYYNNYILQPTVFFKKKVFDLVDMLDEKLNWTMDWDLWIRIGMRFPIKYVKYRFANARVYSLTKTNTGGIKRRYEMLNLQFKYAKINYVLIVLMMFAFYLDYNVFKKININYHLFHKISSVLKLYVRRLFFVFKGVYPDNWLDRKAKLMFRQEPESMSIKMILDLPDDKRLFPNKVKVKANGNVITIVEMPEPGQYEVQIPYDVDAVKPSEIELKFSKSLPPDELRRRLACKLEGVTYVV